MKTQQQTILLFDVENETQHTLNIPYILTFAKNRVPGLISAKVSS